MKPVDNSNTKKKAARGTTAASSNVAATSVWSSDHTVFLGEYAHKVDEKGRLALPAKFRSQLTDGAVVTCGPDKVLHLYSTAHWKPLAEKIAALPAWSSKAARTLQRAVLGNATVVTPDRQGRILLPSNLREYAGLASETTADAVVAGLYSRIEIWPAARWRKERQGTDLESIAPKLADLGI